MKPLRVNKRQVAKIVVGLGCRSYATLMTHVGHVFEIVSNGGLAALECATCKQTVVNSSADRNGHGELVNHLNHEFECVTYGNDENASLECVTCSTVIVDFYHPDIEDF